AAAQRALQEAKEKEQKAREDADAAKRKETGRSEAQAILRAPVWTATDLNYFLDHVAAEELLSTRKALKLTNEEATVRALKGRRQDIADIKRQILWCSSNIFEYHVRSPDKIAYHELVKWVAAEAGVCEDIVNSQSTFIVERALCERLFLGIWDKLDQKKRR